MRVDDVGITCPGARAIPAVFNLFQVPFRGGEKKGAAPLPPTPPTPRLLRRREIPLYHRHFTTYPATTDLADPTRRY